MLKIGIFLHRFLTDAALSFPSDSTVICKKISSQIGHQVSHTVVANLLQKFAAQEIIRHFKQTHPNLSNSITNIDFYLG
jgi:hypothetical protein